VAGDDDTGCKWHTTRGAGFDHTIGITQSSGEWFFAEYGADTGFGGGDDGVRIRRHGQYRQGDIDRLRGEHVVPSGVPRYGKCVAAEGEILSIRIDDGDDLTARVQVEGAGSGQASATAADESDTIGLAAVGHGLFFTSIKGV
jgi:hypothetical protein